MGEATAPRPEDCPDEYDAQGRKTGLWSDRDQHGGYMVGEYGDGRRQGVWRHYGDDGRLRSEGPFQDGLVAGRWTWWRANGELLQRGGFDDAEAKHGLWERWTAEGAPLDRGEYDHGRKTGEWTAFHPDGTVRKTTRHRLRK